LHKNVISITFNSRAHSSIHIRLR